jgi:3-deoxy-D-manno-octulosonic-acid transferase
LNQISPTLSLLFYNIFLFFYSLGIRIAAFGNTKAKKWITGRRNLFAEINSNVKCQTSGITNQKSQITNPRSVWMHCASLGEFEQGRPLLEALKEQDKAIKIVLTFFSPSGYEVMKNYTGADHIFYLPMDSSANAKKFIDAVNPSLVLWVKYEYWFYYLTELKNRNIPVILVSGIFRSSQPFFKWYGNIWKKMLSAFTAFFVQQQASKELLGSIGITENVIVSGDTRFDRVIAIAEKFEPIPAIEKFCGDSKVIVAGSTWEDDEEELIHYVRLHPEIKFIIAPHEVDTENLNDVKKEFTGAVFYSSLVDNVMNEDTHVLIIDNVGMLSRLYRYADITYVGGGFGGDGVHNVLEAAVYGRPVLFGPVYEKFAEATGLIESGGGISITNALELEKVTDELLTDETKRKTVSDAAKNYVYSNAGAAQKIVQYIQEKRLLTN